MILLHSSLWGSHAWGLERPTSDLDIFTAYMTPTKTILREPSNERGRSIRDNQVAAGKDEIKHEIGHVIQMLRGPPRAPGPNINYVVGVMSPAVRHTTSEFAVLQNILRRYPAKGVFHSAMGLADSNYKDILTYKAGWDTPKKRCLVMRTLLFAQRIIEDGVYDFGVVKPGDDFTVPEIGEQFGKLRKTFDESPMRERLPDDMLLDWLQDVRMRNLKEEMKW